MAQADQLAVRCAQLPGRGLSLAICGRLLPDGRGGTRPCRSSAQGKSRRRGCEVSVPAQQGLQAAGVDGPAVLRPAASQMVPQCGEPAWSWPPGCEVSPGRGAGPRGASGGSPRRCRGRAGSGRPRSRRWPLRPAAAAQVSGAGLLVTVGRDTAGDGLALLVNGLIARIAPGRALETRSASRDSPAMSRVACQVRWGAVASAVARVPNGSLNRLRPVELAGISGSCCHVMSPPACTASSTTSAAWRH